MFEISLIKIQIKQNFKSKLFKVMKITEIRVLV